MKDVAGNHAPAPSSGTGSNAQYDPFIGTTPPDSPVRGGIPARDGEACFGIPHKVNELELILKHAKNEAFTYPLIVSGMCTAMSHGDRRKPLRECVHNLMLLLLQEVLIDALGHLCIPSVASHGARPIFSPSGVGSEERQTAERCASLPSRGLVKRPVTGRAAPKTKATVLLKRFGRS